MLVLFLACTISSRLPGRRFKANKIIKNLRTPEGQCDALASYLVSACAADPPDAELCGEDSPCHYPDEIAEIECYPEACEVLCEGKPDICTRKEKERECTLVYKAPDEGEDTGECTQDLKDSDQVKGMIKPIVELCKSDEDFGKGCYGEYCKRVWKEKDDKTVDTECERYACDEICKEKHFGWCGLSAGAIAGIVIGCVAFVGIIVGVCVYFFWYRPKQAAAVQAETKP
jgi:hypothetical protein